MVQMSHQDHHTNHGDDDDDRYALSVEDNSSLKENCIESDEKEGEEHSLNSCNSSSGSKENYPHSAHNHKKSNPSNLFELDYSFNDNFPLLFGGNHYGLESAVATKGNGESGSGLVFPVGGMRRVSSCYFSIASAASSTNNNDYFTCVNGSGGAGTTMSSDRDNNNNNIINSSTSLSEQNINNMDAFLLHDVLMNVFCYLDGRSLASFSETARRPNFECFYFLELQLQRALLVGDSHYYCGFNWNCDNDYGNNQVDEDNKMQRDDDIEHPQHNEMYNYGLEDNAPNLPTNNTVIPSFEGSIAGTGVISRLASMDREAARRIVQTYLDSNTSIHAMPLRHSLAYFRQVLLRYKHHPPFASMSSPSSSFPHGAMPSIPENMAKMALLFTFLGAAYMHHQSGDVMMPNIPGPSEVLNEENMEALKNMMLKVGLAGGFLKAGKTMKEKAAQQADRVSNINNYAELNADQPGINAIGEVVRTNANQTAEDISDENNIDNDDGGAATNASMPLTIDADSSSQRQRSVSIGSLEDISNIMPSASAIALRLYNTFLNGNVARYRWQMHRNAGSASKDPNINEVMQPSIIENESIHQSKRSRRSKRSHKTLRPSEGGNEGNESMSALEGNRTFSRESEAADSSEDELTPSENGGEHPDGIISSNTPVAHVVEHPVSPSSVILQSVPHADGVNDPAAAKSFFSFGSVKQESMSSFPFEDGNVPTGCVGAYALAVKTAASEVTRLVKNEHIANFERLSPEEQNELGVRFIDACTSDDKLHIVKEILQKQKKMDVDRFFIGPDDTETCALHVAAFNGAEQVLKFLCGGIDERDPNEDCGLANVNVKDANGWTALHFAAGANSVTSVRVLAEHGAKLTLEASNGYTPFHWAERLSNEEVAAELERLGADNRFVGRWMFGGLGGGVSNVNDRRIPFVSFLANQFFASR